jgi:hypothetical protein
MNIEIKQLSELKPAPYNPRESTKRQEADLRRSLEKFGVVEPIIWNKQNWLHCRRTLSSKGINKARLQRNRVCNCRPIPRG